MKPTSWKQVILYLVILAGIYLLFNFLDSGGSFPGSIVSPGTSEPSTQSGSSGQAESSSSINQIGINELPPEAITTLQLIKNGGPYPYSKDDTVFSNYEKLLPIKPAGYYHEYTVVTPGSKDRGARRIVAGQNGEYYYTSDHYRSFKLIKE